MTDKNEKEEEKFSIFPKSKSITVEDLLNDMDTFDSIYGKYSKDLNSGILPDFYTIPTYTQPVVTTTPSWNTNPNFWSTTITTNDLRTYHTSPCVTRGDSKVEVRMDNDTIEHVTRQELLKYIDERKLIQENELVRKLYERFQVALKLARSDDNGDQGV